MKATLLFLTLSIASSVSFAQAPAELKALLPVGSRSISLSGTTSDQQNCIVDIVDHGDLGFTASVGVVDNAGALDSRRFAIFKLGLGHNLNSLQSNVSSLNAVSTHVAEEQYSSDSRDTLKVQRNENSILSVEVNNETKGFFGYSSEAKEKCILN